MTSTRTDPSDASTVTVTAPPGRPDAEYRTALVTSSLVISAASAAVAGTGKSPATHDRAALTNSGSPAKARVTAAAGAGGWSEAPAGADPGVPLLSDTERPVIMPQFGRSPPYRREEGVDGLLGRLGQQVDVEAFSASARSWRRWRSVSGP